MILASRIGELVLSLSLLTACSAKADARPAPRVVQPGSPNRAGKEHSALDPTTPATPERGPSASSTPTTPDQEQGPSASAPGQVSDASPPPRDVNPPAVPPVDPKTGETPRSLPELKVSLSGLHIGGGPNDSATKRPFIEAIQRGYGAMQACYPSAEEPAKGGTFGVDLRVGRSGGHPTIQSVRAVMKGEKFKACVQRAFEELQFSRPNKPTVLSVSVRFALEP